MQNLFGGQKQQNLEGGITNTNPFKETIERITHQGQVDERFENMERARTLHEFNMERQFQNMKMNEENIMINLNPNVEIYNKNINPEQIWNNQMNMNMENSNYLLNQNINQNVNSMNTMQPQFNKMNYPMMTGIHPMLMEFNKQILTEKQTEKSELKSEIKNEEKTDEKNNQDNILDDIINTMEGQDDERQKNSEFLKFVKRLKTGDIKLNEKENTVDVLNDPMDNMWKKLENQMMSDMNFNQEEDFNGMYSNMAKKEGLFLKDNPFLGLNENTSLEKLGLKENIDLMDYSKEMLDRGEVENARFALEAEVNKNSDNAEAWLSLGKIHTENDRDDLAIECFLRAFEADPFNADALLALGVSCTNEFDEFDAMIHLRNWIKLHHIYNKYFDNQNPFLDHELIKREMANEREDEDYYTKAVRVEGLKQNFYNEMCNLMENIAMNEKNITSDLWIALGIAHFIPHKNERAIECFRKAVEINPNDYNAWNKLGAMLAHSNMNEEAINTYKRALQLKPNYARCWANLGIAYFNRNDYEESMRSFLSALKSFKDIPHVWSYMSSVTLAMNRNDMYEMVNVKNLDGLLKSVGLI